MEKLFQKFQWKDDAMNFHSLSLFPQVRAPPKFKMPSLDKFDGTSYPKAHLKMYTRAFQPLGATEELLAQMFQNTLTGAVLRWFLNLEDFLIRTWRTLAMRFISNTNTIPKWILLGVIWRQPNKSPRKLSQSLS